MPTVRTVPEDPVLLGCLQGGLLAERECAQGGGALQPALTSLFQPPSLFPSPASAFTRDRWAELSASSHALGQLADALETMRSHVNWLYWSDVLKVRATAAAAAQGDCSGW